MPDDGHLTWGFIIEVLDVMERHGYHRGDHEHTGQAIGLIRDVARIYEGTLDAPPWRLRCGAVIPAESLQHLGRPTVIVPAEQVKTLLAAMDDAAEYKRDRAEACSDCAAQSCTTCQWRMQTAGAYDQVAEHMTQAVEASTIRQRVPGHAAPGAGGPHRPPIREAGQ